MLKNELLDRIYETGRVQDADGADVDPYPAASKRPAAEALYEIVSDEGASSTLEVGLAYGLSALAICQAHHERGEGSHVAIDPRQASHYDDIGLLNVQRAGFADRMRLIPEGSERALPLLWMEGHALDFAFVDGLHLFDQCLLDAFYIDRMLKVGGVIGIDDVWMPAMRRVVAFLRTNRAYELLPVRVREDGKTGLLRAGRRLSQNLRERDRSGLTFANTNIAFLRKTKPDERPWNAHAPF